MCQGLYDAGSKTLEQTRTTSGVKQDAAISLCIGSGSRDVTVFGTPPGTEPGLYGNEGIPRGAAFTFHPGTWAPPVEMEVACATKTHFGELHRFSEGRSEQKNLTDLAAGTTGLRASAILKTINFALASKVTKISISDFRFQNGGPRCQRPLLIHSYVTTSTNTAPTFPVGPGFIRPLGLVERLSKYQPFSCEGKAGNLYTSNAVLGKGPGVDKVYESETGDRGQILIFGTNHDTDQGRIQGHP